MRSRLSEEWLKLFQIAENIAEKLESEKNSLHLLLAIFLLKTPVVSFLSAQGIDESDVIEAFDLFKGEAQNTVEKLVYLCQLYAETYQSEELNSFHLMLALTREKRSLAYKVLSKNCRSLPELRKQIELELEQPIQVSIKANNEFKYLENSLKTQPQTPRLKSGEYTLISSRGQFNSPHRNFEKRDFSESISSLPSVSSEEFPPLSPRSPEEETLNRHFSPTIVIPHREELESRWTLNPNLYPYLSKYGKNLNLLAARGELDPLIGRDREVEEIIDILGKRRINNPCLVGEPGVGKTAIVEGLANRTVRGEISTLSDKIFFELDLIKLFSETHLRGSFYERIKGIKEEVKRADGKIIVFIDEIHTLLGGNAESEGFYGAANELKTALSRGEFPCIGATTIRDYRTYIESDPALERRFQKVWVEEPSLEETEEILKGLTPKYASYHRVSYRDEAIKSAVFLSNRYIGEQSLPA